MDLITKQGIQGLMLITTTTTPTPTPTPVQTINNNRAYMYQRWNIHDLIWKVEEQRKHLIEKEKDTHGPCKYNNNNNTRETDAEGDILSTDMQMIRVDILQSLVVNRTGPLRLE